MAAPAPAPAPTSAASARTRPSYREVLRARWTLLAALGTAGIGFFLKLTSELTEGELDPIDRTLLAKVISLRTPTMNGTAVDLTALGSVTVLTLIVTVAVVLFALGRHWGSVSQLLLTVLGGALGSTILKRWLERERPPEVGQLVHVVSYSYPSGHSLGSASVYLTLAILAARRMPNPTARKLIIVFAIVLATVIGMSRAYIGVHYPSDIVAGLSLGAGWALLVSAVFSYMRGKGTLPEARVPFD
jgi:undecaprenyl-diphosphatase